MKALLAVTAFLIGFVTASYVWVVTTQRVTYQHALELWDLKCNEPPDIPRVMHDLGLDMEP